MAFNANVALNFWPNEHQYPHYQHHHQQLQQQQQQQQQQQLQHGHPGQPSSSSSVSIPSADGNNPQNYDDFNELNHRNVKLFNSQTQPQQHHQQQQQQQEPSQSEFDATFAQFGYPSVNQDFSSQQPDFDARESSLFDYQRDGQISFPHPTETNDQGYPIVDLGQFSASSDSSSPLNIGTNQNLLTPRLSENSGNYEVKAKKEPLQLHQELQESQSQPQSQLQQQQQQIQKQQQQQQQQRKLNIPASSSSQKSKKQLLDEQDAILIARDDSELTEEELQMKRKAQNRAAQRAFRERKEFKLKELEAKLLESEEERLKLREELEIIRKQNLSIFTENELLKYSDNPGAIMNHLASANHKQNYNYNDNDNNNNNNYNYNNSNNSLNTNASQTNATTFHFPQNQAEFITQLTQGTSHFINTKTVDKVYDDTEGKKLLAIGAVWDYLQIKAEEANLDSNSIDFNEVMNRLKGHEKCHGYGPAYTLERVNQAIQESMEYMD